MARKYFVSVANVEVGNEIEIRAESRKEAAVIVLRTMQSLSESPVKGAVRVELDNWPKPSNRAFYRLVNDAVEATTASYYYSGIEP